MSMNYYEILELSRNCTAEDVSGAYSRLALKYHPKNSPESEKAVYNYKFNQIAEAYQVLSNPNFRGVFDIYGFDGLRKGIKDKEGNLKGGYKYPGDANDTFNKYFGTSNPFALIKDSDRFDDEYGTMFSSAYGGQYAKAQQPLTDVVVDFECSLEELYNGCVKPLKYERRALNQDGRTTSQKEEERDIEIFKGYDKMIKLTFPGYGNEAPAQKSSDLIVNIKEKKHLKFKRVNKDDLVYTHKLSLVAALNSEPVSLTTLDGRRLTIAMDEIISPQTVKLVKGEGMPIYYKEEPIHNLLFKEKKADLYIKFEIAFPKFIDPEKKEEIIRLLEHEDK